MVDGNGVMDLHGSEFSCEVMMPDIMRNLCEFFLLGDTFSLAPVLLDRADGLDFRGKAYAQDLFLSAFASDPMSREVGMRFRRTVLEPGGT